MIVWVLGEMNWWSSAEQIGQIDDLNDFWRFGDCTDKYWITTLINKFLGDDNIGINRFGYQMSQLNFWKFGGMITIIGV